MTITSKIVVETFPGDVFSDVFEYCKEKVIPLFSTFQGKQSVLFRFNGVWIEVYEDTDYEKAYKDYERRL